MRIDEKTDRGGECPAEALAKADWRLVDGLVRLGGLVTYVYVLQSETNPEAHYIGLTNDTARRLNEHNSGTSVHTNKFRPWKLVVTIGFADPAKANQFEDYLKSGSGRAFAKRHF